MEGAGAEMIGGRREKAEAHSALVQRRARLKHRRKAAPQRTCLRGSRKAQKTGVLKPSQGGWKAGVCGGLRWNPIIGVHYGPV